MDHKTAYAEAIAERDHLAARVQKLERLARERLEGEVEFQRERDEARAAITGLQQEVGKLRHLLLRAQPAIEAVQQRFGTWAQLTDDIRAALQPAPGPKEAP